MCPMVGTMYSTVESNVDKSFPAQRQTYIFSSYSDVFQADSECGVHTYVLMGSAVDKL
jgi:hypothetical protein